MPKTHGDTLRLFVKRLEARSALTKCEVNAVLGLSGETIQVVAHQDFVKLGEAVSHSCIVVDGLVGRFGENRDGVRQITCLYIPGDMPDLPAVVAPKAPWGLGALTNSTILRLPHSELRRIATEFPGLAEAFWRDCVADGSIFSEWVVNVGRRSAIARLAHLFCEMAIRCEHAGLGDRRSFPLPIRQADLGDATGMTGVHANRSMRELRTRSLVDLRAGTVTIHDWDQLRSIGDFDAAFLLMGGAAPRLTEVRESRSL